MELTPVVEKFILHWGEMGTRWGVNRTVAQIHALLYISPAPIHAEQIATTLQVARSNVSTSLRELQGWGIVRIVHHRGDRRDHFESLKDPWEMFQIVLDERKKREIDPTLHVLRQCAQELESSTGEADTYTRERICALLDFFDSMCSWYSQIRKMPTGAIMQFVRLGSKVKGFFASS